MLLFEHALEFFDAGVGQRFAGTVVDEQCHAAAACFLIRLEIRLGIAELDPCTLRELELLFSLVVELGSGWACDAETAVSSRAIESSARSASSLVNGL